MEERVIKLERDETLHPDRLKALTESNQHQIARCISAYKESVELRMHNKNQYDERVSEIFHKM